MKAAYIVKVSGCAGVRLHAEGCDPGCAHCVATFASAVANHPIQHVLPDELPYTGEGTRYEIEGGDFGVGVSPYVNPEINLGDLDLIPVPTV